MEMNIEYFHITLEKLGKMTVFPFHLYVYNKKIGKYSLFLQGNNPLTSEKSDILELLISKGAKIAVQLSQKLTCLRALNLEGEELLTYSDKETHPLIIKQRKAIKRKEAFLDEAPLSFEKELQDAIASEDFTRLIKITRIFVTTFDVTVSQSLSLSTQLADEMLIEDNPTNRIVALSFIIARKMEITNQEILGDLIVAAFFSHIGHTQIHPQFTHTPHEQIEPADLREYRRHMGLSNHLIRKSLFEPGLQVTQIIAQHHERFNGRGYPGYKSGDQINSLALILGFSAHVVEYSSGLHCEHQLTFKEVINKVISETALPRLETSFGSKIIEIVKSLLETSGENVFVIPDEEVA